MADEKKQEITAETSLAPQLGSAPTALVSGDFDQMILTNIDPLIPIPFAYFMLKKPKKGGNFTKKFCQNYLKLQRSVGGWNVNKMNQAIAMSKGVNSTAGEIVKKPNVIARNTYKKDWRDKADREGKQVVE